MVLKVKDYKILLDLKKNKDKLPQELQNVIIKIKNRLP
jgi:hypothetical protein